MYEQKPVSTMINIVSRLDKTQVFCPKGYRFAYDLDDFYQDFEQNYQKQLKLSTDDQRKPGQSSLCLSEVMTIVVLFHGCWIQNI